MKDEPSRCPNRRSPETGPKSPLLDRAIREADLNYLRACQKSAAKTRWRDGDWNQSLVSSTASAGISLIVLPVRAVRNVYGVFVALGSLMGPRVWLSALAIALVCVTVAGWPKPRPSLLELHRKLAGLQIEAEQLRSSDSADERRKVFAERANTEVQSIVSALESYANAADPASLHLLWAARDYFPAVLDAREVPSRNAAAELFSRHLSEAEGFLDESRQKNTAIGQVNIGGRARMITTTVLIIDAVLCCGLAYLVLKKRRWRFPVPL